MFSHILLPLDGTIEAEAALAHAAALAVACGARATCLHVLASAEGADALRPADPLALHLRRTEMSAYLARITARLNEAGVAAGEGGEIVEGYVAERIIGYSIERGADLIILTHRKRAGGVIAGPHPFSVSLAVAHSGCASVLVLSAPDAPLDATLPIEYRRVVVPLDGSQRAECVLPLVHMLASAFGSEVLLAHVVQPPEMPRRTPLSAADADLSSQVVERNWVEAEQYLESLLSRLPHGARCEVVIGDHIAANLHDVVEHNNADLIIVCAHGYSAQTRWPFGSVAASFIEHADRPLLMVQDAPVRAPASSSSALHGRMPSEFAPSQAAAEQE